MTLLASHYDRTPVAKIGKREQSEDYHYFVQWGGEVLLCIEVRELLVDNRERSRNFVAGFQSRCHLNLQQSHEAENDGDRHPEDGDWTLEVSETCSMVGACLRKGCGAEGMAIETTL